MLLQLSVSKPSKAWRAFRHVFEEITPTALGIGDTSPPPPHLQAEDFPVLHSLLSQARSGAHHDIAKGAAWMNKHAETADYMQLRPDICQFELMEKLEAEGVHPALLRLNAPPGCGKTLSCVFLMYGICQADKENNVRRLHWMTAPTKSLVNELVEAVAKVFPPEWFAPLGNQPDGKERMVEHLDGMSASFFASELANIEELAEHARWKLGGVNY